MSATDELATRADMGRLVRELRLLRWMTGVVLVLSGAVLLRLLLPIGGV